VLPGAPTLRLPDGVKPTGYAVHITGDPNADHLSGAIDIQLNVSTSTKVVWLNAKGPVIDKAVLTVGGTGGKDETGTPRQSGTDFVGIFFDAAIPAGAAKLHLEYHAPVPEEDSRGAFREKENGDYYLFTQFESTDARRAFPCFDEPSFKVPWQLTLDVPKGEVAASNTNIVSTKDGSDGTSTVTFAATRPLPSYLVAWTVGPFDVVDAGKVGSQPTPVRILAIKGRGAQAAFTKANAGPILVLLESYFGMPYPYPKLDFVDVPRFFGAMENAGLITCAEGELLSPPDRPDINFQRGWGGTIPHEMAHQWFGDLVTTSWWNDIWLNEAFATWMDTLVVDEWQPDWHVRMNMDRRSGAMRQDSLVSARSIRQPIESLDDIENAFDGITYEKGAAVLRMFELWEGADTFRDGVRRYMKAHADGNATTDDFLAAQSEAAGKDVATPFSTFLDKPGLPLVQVALTCPASGSPVVHLAQRRFLPPGSKGSTDQTWQIPVCMRWGAGDANRSCTLLSTAQADVTLSSKSCPAWLEANDGQAGYYRTLYQGDLLKNLAAAGAALQPIDRAGLLLDLSPLIDTADLSPKDAIAISQAFIADPDPLVASESVSPAFHLAELGLISDDQQPSYQRMMVKLFGSRAEALGLKPAAGESENQLELRMTMLGAALVIGEDPTLLPAAEKLGTGWIDDHSSVAPELADLLLNVAAAHGDKALFDKIHSAAKAADDEEDRDRLYGSLFSFRDPHLFGQALALLTSGELPAGLTGRLVFGTIGDYRTRAQGWAFLKANFDQLHAGLPTDFSSYLLALGGSLDCTDQNRADYVSFFGDRAKTFPGGPRVYQNTLEGMDLCLARKKLIQSPVNDLLKQY
jgi:alanyl aminopeptidase